MLYGSRVDCRALACSCRFVILFLFCLFLIYNWFVLFYRLQKYVHFIWLHDTFWSNFTFLQLLSFLIFLIHQQTLFLEVPQDQIYAIVRIIWKQNTECPGLSIPYFPPCYSQEIRVIQVSLYLINCWQSTPTDEFTNSFHFDFWFKNKEHTLTNDNIHINDCAFHCFLAFVVKGHKLFLLGTWVNGYTWFFCSAIWSALFTWPSRSTELILHPYLLVIVIQTQIKLSYHLRIRFVCLLLNQDIRDKFWNVLDELV